jgi:DNA-binding NarL/FixJ family response regulator
MDTPAIPQLPLPSDTWDKLSTLLKFSPQQKRIVELILLNHCDKQIAAAMQRRHPTVRTYITRIFGRMGVSDRNGLVLKLFAMSHGMCHAQ